MTTTAAVDITVVMPVYNAMRYLPRVTPPLLAAGRAHGGVEFVFVDNGSNDGSREHLEALRAADVRILHHPGSSISALRNLGARAARGSVLSFVDSDCLIANGYFAAATADLAATGAAATGCAYDLPEDPGWIESAWHDMHARPEARNVAYLNAGNFIVRRDAFERTGGFREDLLTGEDAELGQRLNAVGARIHANPAVRSIHLGNPRSLRQFYRRTVWHGVGMFGTVKFGSIDKPTVMMFSQLMATVIGVYEVAAGTAPFAMRVGIALGLQLVVPVITVAYRALAVRRMRGALPCVLLYWLYYCARLHALALIATGAAARYRK